jgi:hypothetical protein
MFLFLPVVIQMGHDTQPSERQLINYWTIVSTLLWQNNKTWQIPSHS